MTAQELAGRFSSPNLLASPKRAGVTELVARTMQWLRDRNAARVQTRRLRVRATVSLGEKRFVSILECDGQQFLIGGGADAVSLLASLSDVPAAATETQR